MKINGLVDATEALGANWGPDRPALAAGFSTADNDRTSGLNIGRMLTACAPRGLRSLT